MVRRVGIGLTLTVAGLLAAPGLAGACTLPGSTELGFSLSRDVADTVTAAQQGSYLQIPFTVPPGT